MAWPRDNQADLITFYGDPARDAVAPQLVKVIPPFRMTYDGKPLSHLMFHRLAAPALERALNRVWDYYGRDQAKVDALGISKTAGTYNRRTIRGSTRWSNHAFGAAIDINAEENGFNVEGNIPIPMIAAFKAEGARWGGDYKGRTDPMHFEFCASGEPVRTFEQWLAFYGVKDAGAKPSTEQPMRFTGITATVFGGPTDGSTGKQTAYANLVAPNWWDRPGVALPARINTRPLPKVKVAYNGRSVIADVIDVGPWNIKDPYWETGTRPRAELGQFDDFGRKPTNKAGIDLTPAAAQAIGLPGKGLVDWDFVDHLEAVEGEVLEPLPKAAQPNLLPLLLLLLLTKETPMTDQPATGQPDLAKVLLTAVLQSALSGKPLDANDLLLTIMRGLLGVQGALPAPAVEPKAVDPAPQNTNDALLRILLDTIAKQSTPAEKPKPVEPPPPAAPAVATDPIDKGAAATGFLGLILSALGQLTGVMPVAGEAATTVGPAVAGASILSLIGGSLGAVSPTLGTIFNIGRGIFGAFSQAKK